MPASPAQDDPEFARKKRTLFLLIGGALSLLLPLLGLAYIKLGDRSWTGAKASAGAAFSRRSFEGAGARLTPSATPAASLSQTGQMSAEAPPPLAAAPVAEALGEAAASPKGSLGFLRGGEDYYHDKSAAPQAATSEPPAPGQSPPAPDGQAPPPQTQTQAAKAPAKPGLRTFSMPKLKPTSGFTDFRSRSGLGQSEGAPAGGVPAGAGMPDMGAMMKGMTGGAGGAGGGAGMPDMGAMMKGMAGGKPGSGPGAGAAPTGASGSNLPAPLPGKKGSGSGAGQPAMPDVKGLLKEKGVDGELGKVSESKNKLPSNMQGMVPDVGGMLNNIPGMGADQNKK